MQSRYQQPDHRGHYGDYGGRFVSETLMAPILELSEAYTAIREDPEFQTELNQVLEGFAGRPTPLYYAGRLTEAAGGAQIYLKREDLAHTGAHKINNTIGQALLARRMGKTRIIAETGAGQHGVATATIAARLGIPAVIYMGAEDIRRQAVNVYRMRLMGAEVRAVEAGSCTLKEAMNEAMRDWVTHVRDTFYVIGSVAGPHPYPMMVRDFQAVLGREARAQCLHTLGRLPEALVACVGGGSNAMGLFYPFLEDLEVAMYGIEAGGSRLDSGCHAAPLAVGRPGILHGSRSHLLQDDHGQTLSTHSISAGLDYPGVGPEHSYLRDSGRVHYSTVDDRQALAAFRMLSRYEGILPALESAHAVAAAYQLAGEMASDQAILVNLSGRGDKDIDTVAKQELE